MLTFSEALIHLKAGEDMKHAGWPAGQFLRAIYGVDSLPKLVLLTATTPVVPTLPAYQLTQPEIFDQTWSKA